MKAAARSVTEIAEELRIARLSVCRALKAS
jgi:hypothetical protein